MFSRKALDEIAQELARGDAAREEGFEGRARVRARRAAGAGIREYLRLIGNVRPTSSAHDLLQWLFSAEMVTPGMRESAGFLLEQVDPAFNLPSQVDLLAVAKQLVKDLEDQIRENEEESRSDE
jgi:hypothetical protein